MKWKYGGFFVILGYKAYEYQQTKQNKNKGWQKMPLTNQIGTSFTIMYFFQTYTQLAEHFDFEFGILTRKPMLEKIQLYV
jgi:hypothetical protein